MKYSEILKNNMASEVRTKRKKLKRVVKCSVYGVSRLGSRGGPALSDLHPQNKTHNPNKTVIWLLAFPKWPHTPIKKNFHKINTEKFPDNTINTESLSLILVTSNT